MSTTYGLRRALLLNRHGVEAMFEVRRRSFAERADRVARLAGALKALGVSRGDRVAVLSLNQDRYLELYLGVAWAGAVIVPLNIRWSAPENGDALRDSRPRVLVVDAAFSGMGAALAETIGLIRLVHADDAPSALPEGAANYEAILAASSPVPDAEADETDLAGIFYTGGTTGRSKGVMLSHRSLMSNARNVAAELGPIDDAVYLHAAPMFHVADVSAMYSTLLGGAAHAFLRMFTPTGLAHAIDAYRVSDVFLVPTMIWMLVDFPGLSGFDLSSLRRVTYGASPMSEAVLDRAIARLPNVEFKQGYGMTELSPTATFLHWKDHLGQARVKGRHRSGGRPVLGVEVRIVDPRTAPFRRARSAKSSCAAIP